MLEFKREGSTIQVKVDTSINWNFTPVINCGSEPYAILLRQNFADNLYNELTSIRREAAVLYLNAIVLNLNSKPKKVYGK